MKLYFVSVAITFLSFSQNAQMSYQMINEIENVILDRYNIDYTGAHVRYMVESKKVEKLDSETKAAMKIAYKKFKKWNKNYFKNLPDSTYFSDGHEYMLNKSSDSFLKLTFNDSRKIVGKFSKYVADEKNDIQTIEILELYNTGIPNYIDHVVMIQNYSNEWFVLTSTYDKVYIEFPQNPIP
ncbi:MAG: hypothetical protein ACKO6J_03245 [Crocinitomicaceae bacterium]